MVCYATLMQEIICSAVVAKVLGHPEREDWKMCTQAEEEERNDANEFKAAFKTYDFN